MRQRVRRLLNLLTSAQWRRARVIEILENMDPPEARRLLTTLALGAPHAMQRRQLLRM